MRDDRQDCRKHSRKDHRHCPVDNVGGTAHRQHHARHREPHDSDDAADPVYCVKHQSCRRYHQQYPCHGYRR